GAHGAVALARLYARRLDRDVGDLRPPHHRGGLGRERAGDARPPAQRGGAGDADQGWLGEDGGVGRQVCLATSASVMETCVAVTSEFGIVVRRAALRERDVSWTS